MKYKMNITKASLAIVMTMSIILASCAKKADHFGEKYVSPAMYNSYDCEQINMERQRLTNRLTELELKQNELYKSDLALGLIGILFWPIWFAIQGDGEAAAELGRVKGSFTALQQVSVEKKCGV
jgi:hypothetical protein